MVGGNVTAFEQVKPILEKLGKLAMLVGDNGAGNVAKLAINTLLGIAAQGLAEAVILAKNNGIDPGDLTTLINNSALGSAFGKIKGDALKLIAKDLRLAKDIGLSTPLGETVYQTFQQAEVEYGNEDIIAIIKQVDHK
jgi:3-hydroxyisobutyrate dehydrogenase